MNEAGNHAGSQGGYPPPGGGQGYYPPSGTYPPPYAEPIYNTGPPPAPEEVKKTRRVGTITMAICLIALGVVLVLAVFVPSLDLVLVARLAPLVIVLLGAEILIAHIRHRDEKLRYDALSIVLCAILIFCSLFAAVVPAVFQRQIDLHRTGTRLEAELQAQSYEALDAQPGVGPVTADWYVDLVDTNFAPDMTVSDIAPGQYVQLYLYFNSEFKDAAAFADACHEAAEKLSDFTPHINYATFASGSEEYDLFEGQQRYTLSVDSNRLYDFTAKDMAGRVRTEHWLAEDGYGYYIDEWEYQDRLANPQDYGLYDEDAVYDEDDAYDDAADWEGDPLRSEKPVFKNGLAPADADLPAAA